MPEPQVCQWVEDKLSATRVRKVDLKISGDLFKQLLRDFIAEAQLWCIKEQWTVITCLFLAVLHWDLPSNKKKSEMKIYVTQQNIDVRET